MKENSERVRFHAKDEVQRLLAECPKHLGRIVICAINAGLRRGEILKLKWNDINFRTGHIHGGESKTGEAVLVPMNDTLILMLKEMRKEQGFSSDYVFTYRKSEDKLKGAKPVRKRKNPEPIAERIKSVKTAFNAAMRRARIKDFRFHGLRHTCASHIIMNGGSLKEVQEILRHKDIKTTLRYAHLSEEHKKKAINLNGLTASPRGPTNRSCHKSVIYSYSKSSVSARM